MKKLLFLVLSGALLVLAGCGNKPDSQSAEQDNALRIPAKFRTQLTEAVKIYLQLKDALVKADDQLAHQSGLSFKEALSAIDMSTLSENLQLQWKNKLADLTAEIEMMLAKEDLMEQRSAFLPLSESVIECARDYGPLDITLYVQHCPMAFDNSGGDWLSDSDQVYNPYFGRMMLHCGTVTDTLSAL